MGVERERVHADDKRASPAMLMITRIRMRWFIMGSSLGSEPIRSAAMAQARIVAQAFQGVKPPDYYL
jgi:hypothetical protein